MTANLSGTPISGRASGTASEKMTEGETIAVTGPRVACDGGGGTLGHPRVWLTLGTDGEITCPYCSRRYVKATGTDDD